MDHDAKQELAALKATLVRGEDRPDAPFEALLRRHPYAAAAVALGAGLLLAGRPRIARSFVLLAGWGARHLLRRALPRWV